jgi:hypothetical protein
MQEEPSEKHDEHHNNGELRLQRHESLSKHDTRDSTLNLYMGGKIDSQSKCLKLYSTSASSSFIHQAFFLPDFSPG